MIKIKHLQNRECKNILQKKKLKFFTFLPPFCCTLPLCFAGDLPTFKSMVSSGAAYLCLLDNSNNKICYNFQGVHVAGLPPTCHCTVADFSTFSLPQHRGMPHIVLNRILGFNVLCLHWSVWQKIDNAFQCNCNKLLKARNKVTNLCCGHVWIESGWCVIAAFLEGSDPTRIFTRAASPLDLLFE